MSFVKCLKFVQLLNLCSYKYLRKKFVGKKAVEGENSKVENFYSSLFRCSSSYLGAAREGASGGKDGGAWPSGLHPEPQ